jgi:hypothetical protein
LDLQRPIFCIKGWFVLAWLGFIWLSVYRHSVPRIMFHRVSTLSLHSIVYTLIFDCLLRAKALRTHFVLFARNSIRFAHVLLCSIVCPLCRCTPSCTHLYLIVRSLTYSLHSYCSLALCSSAARTDVLVCAHEWT